MSIELVSNRVGETRVRDNLDENGGDIRKCEAAAGSEVGDDDRASQAFLWSPLFIMAARE
jgi:hypothetical protein